MGHVLTLGASRAKGKPLTPRRLTGILTCMKMLIPIVLLACPLFGCSDDGDSTSAPDAFAPQDAGVDSVDGADITAPEPDIIETIEIAAPSAWTQEVQMVSFVDSEVISGDTTGGSALGGTWGYQAGAGCWMLPEGVYYGGDARFFAPSPVPGQNTKLTVTLTPEAGVDLNLSVLTMPLDEFWFPPTVELASCYSSRTGGPGEPEEKKIFTITDVSNVLVMVVAPEGEAGGAFELSFLLEQ